MKIDSQICGRWVHEDEDSDAEYVILIEAGYPHVSATCISDGERMDILDLRCDGDTLCFDTVVPSSGYRASNKMRFVAPDSCEFELTTRERWKKK